MFAGKKNLIYFLKIVKRKLADTVNLDGIDPF